MCSDYPEAIRHYLMKIPIVGEKTIERFQNKALGVSTLSLGLAIKIVKEEIIKICEITKKQKKWMTASLKLTDPKTIVKVKSMVYSQSTR